MSLLLRTALSNIQSSHGTKQYLYSCYQPHLDLWHPTMGHCLHLRHRDYGALSIESPASNNWCTMVCPKCLIRNHPQAPAIKEEIARLSSKYSAGPNTHPNHPATQLSNPPAFRRLRTLLPSDLYNVTHSKFRCLTHCIHYHTSTKSTIILPFSGTPNYRFLSDDY
jgi:hypothetical protein